MEHYRRSCTLSPASNVSVTEVMQFKNLGSNMILLFASLLGTLPQGLRGASGPRLKIVKVLCAEIKKGKVSTSPVFVLYLHPV